MSEEQDNNTPEASSASESEGPAGGERLAQARRELQISVLEVAKELHLDEAKVRALERNEFDVLGAPVFAKGHLRKYAQLVGVNEDDIFTDYYKMTHLAELPPVVIGRPKVRRELSPGPWIAAIVVIVIAAAAYWWFASGSGTAADEDVPAEVPATEEPVPEESGSDELAGETADSAAEPEPAIVIAEATPEEIASVSVEEPQPVDDGLTRVELTFTGECWTEISDATGRRLFFNMGRAGRTVELAGEAPFSALFGNVANVSVLVDGNDYPVRPNRPGSRTARLSIIKP